MLTDPDFQNYGHVSWEEYSPPFQGLGFTHRKKWTPRKQFRKVAAWSELGDGNFPGKF